MSVRDRLARLLFIVPYVSARDGVPVGELAAKLGGKVAQARSEARLLVPLRKLKLLSPFDSFWFFRFDQVYTNIVIFSIF